MTDDNIIRLAALQDAGELPASSEDAMALVYAERHAEDFRYVAAWGRWMLYDGTIGAPTARCMHSIAPG